MKKTLAITFTAILIALLVIPAGMTLADQDFHTIKIPIYLTAEGEAAGHTLQNGWWRRANTEGPVNYMVEAYKLTGALPDTRYDIGSEFAAYPGVVFTEEDFFIQTNEHGNGYLHFKATPDQMRERMYPATSSQWSIVLVEGGTPTYLPQYGVWVIYGGTHAFETEVFEVHYDWDW